MMISKKLSLVFTIILVLAVLVYISNHEHPSTTTNNTNPQSNAFTIENRTYKLATKEFSNILKEAKDLYLNVLKMNETWKILIYEPYSNFSKTFILNTTILNETTLLIDHAVYKYVVVHVYNAESKFNFMPQRIHVDDLLIELLPRNKSVTYTGVISYNYRISYGNETYETSFSSIGFIEASYYLTVSTNKVSDNIYQVKITTARKIGNTAYINVAWIILIKED
ncbi:hypothetical protein PFDSM3638_10065 [Pyrococcus furiosus DSM 3638]|uniref:Uncharacterized protein n=3 Tax=Pyrococcus furiosus TaxID=2261 RepID=Q8TZJ5_PYRFU|nr:hypothetical protein [Pyrococcus furiosus]AAL82121.1 hypothetical protein PF1997 [Pyrococcus furiosus DSM 3638]AFN04646.1 hypothetical protein PFC_08580 [Pyrococcus furiosus COM1]QEK79590.1 hypothetical protein PFDSM3638_10065 [Pyrococcus furiosus DSM 3638]